MRVSFLVLFGNALGTPPEFASGPQPVTPHMAVASAPANETQDTLRTARECRSIAAVYGNFVRWLARRTDGISGHIV